MPSDSLGSPSTGPRRRYSSATIETMSGITSGSSSKFLQGEVNFTSNDNSGSMSNFCGDSAQPEATASASKSNKIFDDPEVILGYQSVPLIELDKLPRGGLSFETKAVGRIQVSKTLSCYLHIYRRYTHHRDVTDLSKINRFALVRDTPRDHQG